MGKVNPPGSNGKLRIFFLLFLTGEEKQISMGYTIAELIFRGKIQSVGE